MVASKKTRSIAFFRMTIRNLVAVRQLPEALS